jgi:hypothetical protein
MATVVQTTAGGGPPATIVTDSTTGTVVTPTPVIREEKVVKPERVTYQSAAPVRKGGFRARLGGFLGGFTLATLGYFVLLRGDVLEVTQNIEQTFVPAAVTLQAKIGRLEARVDALEKQCATQKK